MKRFILAALGVAVLTAFSPAPVMAGMGVIDRACRGADRSAATPQLCRCIQRVANDSLSWRERRTVARWFRDPHRAQEVRQSDRRRDEVLWERHRAFGARARKICG